MIADKLLSDLNTFGFMFESLVERDLRIYMDYLDGKLYHYRDNKTGHEVDAVVELPDGDYGIIEIKLSPNGVEDAKKSLRAELGKLIRENKDYKLGKGVHEFSSIVSTVFILAGCAPILSQIILHPVMDLIFKKGKNGKSTKEVKTQEPNTQVLKKEQIEKIANRQTKPEEAENQIK